MQLHIHGAHQRRPLLRWELRCTQAALSGVHARFCRCVFPSKLSGPEIWGFLAAQGLIDVTAKFHCHLAVSRAPQPWTAGDMYAPAQYAWLVRL